jgi:hypothetical protein
MGRGAADGSLSSGHRRKERSLFCSHGMMAEGFLDIYERHDEEAAENDGEGASREKATDHGEGEQLIVLACRRY